MNPIDREEPARDAWLSEALRHAPDALASAPPALSDAILRQARAAAASARKTVPPRPTRTWAAAVWSWLARPPLAAGFASVMVAALVGLLWWDRPMDEALPAWPAAPVTAAPAAAPATEPAVTGAVGAASAAAEVADGRAEVAHAAPPPHAGAEPAAKARPPASPSTPPTARRDRPAPVPFGAERKRLQAPDPEKAVKEDVQVQPAAQPAPPLMPPTTIQAPAAMTPAPAEARAAPASPQLTAPPSAEVQLQRELSAPRAADSAVAPAARDESGQSTTAKAASNGIAAGALAKVAPAPEPPAAFAAPRRQELAAKARTTPLAELLAQIAAQPQRWSWQRSGGVQAMTPSLQAWLAQLDAASAARWSNRAANDMEVDKGLRLYRDGSLQATLGLTDTGVSFAPAAAAERASHAALAPSLLTALKRALDEAAP